MTAEHVRDGEVERHKPSQSFKKTFLKYWVADKQNVSTDSVGLAVCDLSYLVILSSMQQTFLKCLFSFRRYARGWGKQLARTDTANALMEQSLLRTGAQVREVREGLPEEVRLTLEI